FPAGAEPGDPNLVKVVVTRTGYAMYFSRSPIPFYRETSGGREQHLLHLGIYGYRREFLFHYASWPPTPCEQAEKLEQLRALECGHMIHVTRVDRATPGI